MTHLKIAVLIKQVPGSPEVEIDPVTGVMKRDSAAAKLNPYDLFALEEALRIRESYGGSITVLTMGPTQAEDSLREALAMGADDAVLLCDRRLAGSDVLATSTALANALMCCGRSDIILTGKQTTDGDTAQVGPEVAEMLGIPHACGVTAFCAVSDGSAELTYALGRYVCRARVSFPMLVVMDKDVNTPRLPSFTRMKAVSADAVRRISIDDFKSGDAAQYGISGSATSVERMFPPKRTIAHDFYREDDDMLAERFYRLLKERKIV